MPYSLARRGVRATLFAAVSALPFAFLSAPAAAQHSMPSMPNMPGMHENIPQHPAAKRKPAAKKHTASKAAPHKAAGKRRAGRKTPAPGAHGGQMPATDRAMVMSHGSMTGHGTMTAPTPADHTAMHHGSEHQPSEPGAAATEHPMDHPTMDHGTMGDATMDHGGMNQGTMGQGAMASGEHGKHGAMAGALGPYPMQRESSGTAWQPDSSGHMGVMTQSGGWMLMGHGLLNLVYDHQSGPRGDDKTFFSGMVMGMASRPLGNGTIQFRAMLSPDPLMGKRGYPLLLASGETANGIVRLIDRQHPHDLFMELSASVSQNIGPKSSLFVYGGLPSEPAFGPPAFMHRESILDSPEAPISHHWLDSTHISFGVVTAGVVFDQVKVEVSRFNAREPDQHRWDIETGPLDSTAVRISWNPTRTLALQGSWGHFKDPEQLEPGVNQKRWSASALYADEIAPGWKLAATLAWGRKEIEGRKDDAVAAEASLKHRSWTLFGRGEMAENRELIAGADGPAFRVGKLSLGAIHDFAIANHVSLGLGGLAAVNFVPDDLAPRYGGNNPIGTMGFVRLKLN
jgi:hypothetical protein